MKRYKNNRRFIHVTSFILLLVLSSCGSKRSEIKAHINDPANGYMKEIKTEAYTLRIQYQPPAYRADQEIMLNHSEVNKKELIKEYDQLQQFLVSYHMENKELYPDDFGNMSKFNLICKDTIYCLDAHQLPNSPGNPDHEMLLLFPVSEKELGKEFVMNISGFPEPGSKHQIKYILNIN